MKNDSFERVTSFLLGASWAFIALGALLAFRSFLIFDIFTAFFAAFLFVFFSLFLLLGLDAFIVNKKRLEEAKKQTKLLEQIDKKLSDSTQD